MSFLSYYSLQGTRLPIHQASTYAMSSTPQNIYPHGQGKKPRRLRQGHPSTAADSNFNTSDSGNSPPGEGAVIAEQDIAEGSAASKGKGRKKKPIKEVQSGRKIDQYRHRPSQPSFHSPQPVYATPAKQTAYAGPTFHQSPAPSSLPMPSGFNKSAPDISRPKSSNPADDRHHSTQSNVDLPLNSGQPTPQVVARDSIPLEYFFEAARKAKTTRPVESPGTRSGQRTPFEDSPVNRSGDPRGASSEADFPFELDGDAGQRSEIGPAFSTPYSHRINAAKYDRQNSSASPSDDPNVDHDKTAAFKSFLAGSMRTGPPVNRQPPNNYGNIYGNGSQFSPRSDGNLQQPVRYTPNPPPLGHNAPDQAHHPFSTPAPTAPGFQTYNGGPSPKNRPVSSHLRNEYQLGSAAGLAELSSDGSGSSPRISTARRPIEPTSRTQSTTSLPSGSAVAVPATLGKPTYTTDMMNEEMRRILKLPMTSGG